MQIFSWIGNVFGYLLWFFYEFTKNYGVSIILFTIVLKIIMFPFSIKQQKSMAKNTRQQGNRKRFRKNMVITSKKCRRKCRSFTSRRASTLWGAA